LVQHLAPTEFIIVRINAFEGDRAKHIQDVASGSGDGKPALFMRASHFTFDESEDTSDLCKAIVDHRIQEHKASLENFKYQLKRTYWLHIRVNSDKQDGDRHCHHFTSFEDRIHKNHLGDKPTTDTVQAAIEAAKKAYREDDWKEYYRPAGKALSDKDTKPLPEYPTGLNNSHGVTHVTRMAFELRTWASKLSKLTTLIVHQERSLRFIQNVRLVQCGGLLTCSHCGASNLKPNDVKVMAQCGHLLAVTCCSGNDCPVIGCKAFNREYQKLAGSGFGQAKFDSCSSHGSKMDAVLELIQHIVEDKDEKVLVFVQHKQSTDKLEATLKDAGIVYSDLRNETTSSDVLNSYQTGKASKNGAKPSKVLILNIGDANASGR
jgi:SNF2 family DNA or RNA helicase